MIQSAVGEALSLATFNLWFERYRRLLSGMYVPDYRILLGIHDALLVECKEADVHVMINEVLPFCMTDKVILPNIDLKLGIDIEVYYRWGVSLTDDEADKLGLPRKKKKIKEEKPVFDEELEIEDLE